MAVIMLMIMIFGIVMMMVVICKLQVFHPDTVLVHHQPSHVRGKNDGGHNDASQKQMQSLGHG